MTEFEAMIEKAKKEVGKAVVAVAKYRAVVASLSKDTHEPECQVQSSLTASCPICKLLRSAFRRGFTQGWIESDGSENVTEAYTTTVAQATVEYKQGFQDGLDKAAEQFSHVTGCVCEPLRSGCPRCLLKGCECLDGEIEKDKK